MMMMMMVSYIAATAEIALTGGQIIVIAVCTIIAITTATTHDILALGTAWGQREYLSCKACNLRFILDWTATTTTASTAWADTVRGWARARAWWKL